VVRNSQLDGWTNAVWNQVFSGDTGNVPAQSFPNPTFTTLATSRVSREAPFLYQDAGGAYNVLVPSAQQNTSGTTWSSGPTPGTSIPINSFFIARPSDSAATINTAIQRGQNLILTPGVYKLDAPIAVTRPDSVVLGLGFPTLTPTNGNAAMTVASAKGMILSGVLFDAGAITSPVLLQVGDGHARSDNEASDPSLLADVFFRIGGAAAGSATTSLVVNSNNTILDDIWAWRADHGSGVGWTTNTADTGVVVNGANVTAYGLFVEHFQKYEVIWNGNGGSDVFFQNEMPYDAPNQKAWRHDGDDGFPAYEVADNVKTHEAWGLGSYCYFNVDPTIHATRAFDVPVKPGIQLHDLLTVQLGAGTIDHVVNDTGASTATVSTGTPVNVVGFP